MTDPGKCFLCAGPCESRPSTDSEITMIQCESCGRYGIAFGVTATYDDAIDARLRAACVSAERNLRGLDDYVILPKPGGEIAGHPTVGMHELIDAYPGTAVELLDRALLNLSRMVKHPGGRIKLSGDRPTVVFSTDVQELCYVIDQFYKLGYIGPRAGVRPTVFTEPGASPVADVLLRSGFCIAGQGWRRIGELAQLPAGTQAQAFVAMWFDPSMEDLYEKAIKPAVEADQKTRCVRVDLVEHNDKICDQIIAEIRRSKYVVADFTGQRGGVYFEAGFAQGLGIPVIWTVKACDVGKLHFDTRQYNHIVYDSAEDLLAKLANRIRATIP